MNQSEASGDDFSASFEDAFGRLRLRVEAVCASSAPWPERAAAAISAVLDFAAEDPDAAALLTTEALAHDRFGEGHYDRLLTYLGDMLEGGRAHAVSEEPLPEFLERALAGGIAAIISNRVDLGRVVELPDIAPEAIQFVLTPYVGAERAIELAARAA